MKQTLDVYTAEGNLLVWVRALKDESVGSGRGRPGKRVDSHLSLVV